MGAERSPSFWRTITIVASVIGGGFMGSIFTWWINQKTPATIGYVISSTTTGADASVSALVPNLTLRIGNEQIPAIHTHVIELTVIEGYAESVTFAIVFGSKPRVFGRALNAPTSLHSLGCVDVADGLKCTIAPVNPPVRYRVQIATDSPEPPTLVSAARDVRLTSLAEIAAGPRRWTTLATYAVMLAAFALVILLDRLKVVRDANLYFAKLTLEQHERSLGRAGRERTDGNSESEPPKPKDNG